VIRSEWFDALRDKTDARREANSHASSVSTSSSRFAKVRYDVSLDPLTTRIKDLHREDKRNLGDVAGVKVVYTCSETRASMV
jgi:hypothetical protein